MRKSHDTYLLIKRNNIKILADLMQQMYSYLHLVPLKKAKKYGNTIKKDFRNSQENWE
jgi:hypothetical protein